ncbi:Ldh family oxidoreductase [Paenibacillus hamazuiensis]|uniref:Ldh family oxidoreductase n=1 Tax=Paenibacillus hamazuiensis TaxID=2936508 RepID=UPI0020108E58|nr:Ldh family oxidoreductase [Paenibacillus hamazuiensis]
MREAMIPDMRTVGLVELERFIHDAVAACGVPEEDCAKAVDVFMRATLRGVGHHDIYDLPSRISRLLSGEINAKPQYKQLSAFKTMEAWDVDRGLGEVVCCFAMERAKRLADEYGIGMCIIRNSNHFLAAAPYVERAAEEGYISLLLCKGGMNMGTIGRTENCMGSLPLGFGFSAGSDAPPVVFDACLAYASHGELRARAAKGIPIEPWWGVDTDGQPTTDPAKVLEGTRMPIGGHKGYALSMLGEVLSGVFTGGWIMDQAPDEDAVDNHWGHTALVIKPDTMLDMAKFKQRTSTLLDRADKLAPGVHIPGHGSYRRKAGMLSKGTIDLESGLVEKLAEAAARLGIAPLINDRS